ncbi:amino acid transporter [Streptococcus lutetiensis]|uniref:amino acid transporter n=1 Tax=Streptococcus lutetiensis TaxID=150055 RepID=UPI001F070378|nr:amino acid transporter [Streptococcus lutetiensis]
MTLFASVFKSVYSRRDVKIFLSFTLLPILVPLLSDFMEGMNSDVTGNFLVFLTSAISTQYRFVLPVLLFSLVVSSVFKDEIDMGIMFLYKDINRKKIYNAKLLSLFLVYGIFLFGTVIMSIIAYFGIMFPQGKVSLNIIPSDSIELRSTVFSFITIIVMNLITTCLVSMVSITSKTIKSVMIGVFFSLLVSVSPMLIGINYLFPLGYVELSEKHFALSVVVATILSIVYFMTFYLKGKSKFDQVEF